MAKQPNFKDAEKQLIHLNYFQGGGQNVDYKLGIPNSFYTSEALDFRSAPSQMTALPGMTDIANNQIQGTVTAMEQDRDGVRYALTDTGNLYTLNTDGTIVHQVTLSEDGAAGLFYDQITDSLYIPGQTKVSTYGQLTSGIPDNPIFNSDLFEASASNDPGCVNIFNSTDGYYDGTARNNLQTLAIGVTPTTYTANVSNSLTSTYSIPGAISEATGEFCFFAPDIEPANSIAVYIAGYTSGTLTLTLHDAQNNQLAKTTISSPVIGWNLFSFSSPVRLLVQQSQTGASATYHWHISSSVADTNTVATNVSGDVSTANFVYFADRLVQPNNKWHPTAYFNGLLCIGNERYLSTYDFSNNAGPTTQQWERHNLIFQAGYEVCGLTTNNMYLVIALERRSSDSAHNYQDGILAFWDGTSQNPAFFIEIPMGAPYGLQTFNNVTYFVCGGSLFAWSGGQTVVKVRKLAYQNTNYLGTYDNTIVNPNSMAIRYNLLMIGYPSTTTATNIKYGVYTWGAVEVMYPNSLGYDYVLSNGEQYYTSTNNLTIGGVWNYVDTMYVSWKYTDAGGVTHYGLDRVNNSSNPAPNFNWRSLIYDAGVVYKVKEAYRLQVTFTPLPANTQIYPVYNINRSGDVVSSISASEGDMKAVLEFDSPIRFHEIQWGFNGTSTGTKPIEITGVTMEIGTLPEETDITANVEE